MKTKDEFRRSLKLHVPEGTEKLSNYHAVCIELERARALYGSDFSDGLVKEFNLGKFGIRELSI